MALKVAGDSEAQALLRLVAICTRKYNDGDGSKGAVATMLSCAIAFAAGELGTAETALLTAEFLASAHQAERKKAQR